MDTHLMLGNEAVARGAWEAGVQIAAAYPGTRASTRSCDGPSISTTSVSSMASMK